MFFMYDTVLQYKGNSWNGTFEDNERKEGEFIMQTDNYRLWIRNVRIVLELRKWNLYWQILCYLQRYCCKTVLLWQARHAIKKQTSGLTEKGPNINSKKVTKIVLLNVLVLVNIVSNISLLICEVQIFLFLPKTLSPLNTSFISLKFLQRDWISFATNLLQISFTTKEILICKN